MKKLSLSIVIGWVLMTNYAWTADTTVQTGIYRGIVQLDIWYLSGGQGRYEQEVVIEISPPWEADLNYEDNPFHFRAVTNTPNIVPGQIGIESAGRYIEEEPPYDEKINQVWWYIDQGYTDEGWAIFFGKKNTSESIGSFVTESPTYGGIYGVPNYCIAYISQESQIYIAFKDTLVAAGVVGTAYDPLNTSPCIADISHFEFNMVAEKIE